jgi:NTP pyrophosphatase (non-canonical NTP hydrolase)
MESSLFKRHLDEVINPCWNFAGRCKTWEDEVQNTVLGLGGEAGEIVDQVKKMLYHTEKGVEFHREKLVSELGDSMFYHIKFMQLMGITLEECLQNNARKLASRHPELGQVTERFGEGYLK